jgi:hypothetical protein
MMPPPCQHIGHDWTPNFRFHAYFPRSTLSYTPEPVHVEQPQTEAFAIQGCRARGCIAYRVLNYDGRVVKPGTDEYARAAEVLKL